jgi:hypothetical protein
MTDALCMIDAAAAQSGGREETAVLLDKCEACGPP